MAAADRLARVDIPVALDEWQQIYCVDPRALPSQSPNWAEAIVSALNRRNVSRIYRFESGRRVIVPLFERRRALHPASSWNSPPQAWGFGGTIEDGPIEIAHLSAILDDLARHAPLGVRLRPNPLAADLWDQAAGPAWRRVPRNAHVLDLSGGYDTVWTKHFKPRTRTAIRKAGEAGFEVECGQQPALLDAFLKLYSSSVGRWAAKQHELPQLAHWRAGRRDPPANICAQATAMGEECTIWVARHKGAAAAAIVVFSGHNAHYTRGAISNDPAVPPGAALLLQHLAIKGACGAGCNSYHMGETGRSESLAQFKSRFGAVATPYAEYVFERLPVSRITDTARAVVKKVIGFRDA